MKEINTSKEGAVRNPGTNQNAWESVMPIVLFIALNRLVGLAWAIGAATFWSVIISIRRWRNGHPIGKFIPIVTIGILVRGIIGIVTDSEAVYFGIGIGTKALIGIALIVTTAASRNYLAMYATTFIGFDASIASHHAFKSAMNRIAYGIGVAQLVSAVFDIWLYNNASVDGYLVIRFFVNWPYTTAVIILSMLYLGKKLSVIPGFPGIASVMENRLEAEG
ncbi:MAG: DUF3159 domain-containing protein [Acidimicrobiales bacterium]|nr:DUF3159 domain-containing protein [Acidimicrobiales bacterium]MDP6298294.1 DUF3159 domain-containing protein [Acidimicrobiales bacterium]HJM28577.1 DUF3159 domain-containing protein [Acidimicrobiales bacterium]HJM98133.1 DUF3159 domain-containing protein [Acidimicrobiales bacterium]